MFSDVMNFFFFLRPVLFLKNTFIYLFIIDLFLAVLGLRCCTWAFSSCGEQGLLFLVVPQLLIEVASLVVEHGLLARASVVVACGLSSCGSRTVDRRLSSCGARA